MSKEAFIESLKLSGWYDHLKDSIESENFNNIRQFLSVRKDSAIIYPALDNIFKAFFYPKFDEIDVVIIGQDPYHAPKQATGLAFGVPNGIIKPPSLRNIFKEVEVDCGGFMPDGLSELTGWQNQGVMLLNSVLTVEQGNPGSHSDIGWQSFTDAAISALSKRNDVVVFMLWGKYAQSKEKLIDINKHAILKAPHPSPFSAHTGFFGCRHFSKANDILSKYGKDRINWFNI